MAVPERLAEKLACPICHQPLVYNREKNRLECHNCHLAFRIDKGIPVLVPDEAEKLE
jgi:uncharacterized protein YbaR (Trm112 family)